MSHPAPVPFNRTSIVGREVDYLRDTVENRHSICGSATGYYTAKCCELMQQAYGSARVLLTTSCTTALEMAAILAGLKPGDEVILPSFTFVSTANAFVLRGARPVFAEIREDTLNIDESKVEALISPATRALFVVHYAGVSAEMDALGAIARKHNLVLIEDAAQGVDASYKGRALGTIGHLGAYSFHETKNLTCGEGGALLVNDPRLVERAEVMIEKGTNRKKFLQGMVDKYSWVDLGSSAVLSELNAAYLYGQLEQRGRILENRLAAHRRYAEGLRPLQDRGMVRLPVVPAGCVHNAHTFHLICRTKQERDGLIAHLREQGVQASFHYVPLHQSDMGRRIAPGAVLPVTESMAERLVRLPMYYGLEKESQERVIAATTAYCDRLA